METRFHSLSWVSASTNNWIRNQNQKKFLIGGGGYLTYNWLKQFIQL